MSAHGAALVMIAAEYRPAGYVLTWSKNGRPTYTPSDALPGSAEVQFRL